MEQDKDDDNDVLKEMVKTLDELPTEVLRQLLKNLDELEEYNRTHPDEEFDDDEEDE